MNIADLIETIIALSIVFGASFALIGSIGLVRLRDAYSRLHGPTKATTLGVGGLLVASVLHFSTPGDPSLHEVLVTIFLFLTAPVSAHMLARAALRLGVPSVTHAAAGRRSGFVSGDGRARRRSRHRRGGRARSPVGWIFGACGERTLACCASGTTVRILRRRIRSSCLARVTPRLSLEGQSREGTGTRFFRTKPVFVSP